MQGNLDPETKQNLTVVGVGASSGGLSAFKTFISGINPETTASYVLIQHLEPSHDSYLAGILSKDSPLPLHQVENTIEISPGNIYVIKPNSELTIEKNVLKISDLNRHHGQQTPIDIFFRSLAEDQKERAIGIVLSGVGSDGAMGLQSIKAMGGFTVCQDPDEAEFDRMPKSAIFNGGVDLIVSTSKMGDEIDRYIQHVAKFDRVTSQASDSEKVFTSILDLIRTRKGNDFTSYKKATIYRRIKRRISVLQLNSVEEYYEKLQNDPSEVAEIAQDLLISVTSFFRDLPLWEKLENSTLPELLRTKSPDEQFIRVWVPGCATGEEAYSMAILLHEAVERSHMPLKIQVYATDINAKAREYARKAIYPSSIVQDVREDRLKKYFRPEGEEHYRIAGFLRDLVVFARHDITLDPPFPKLDIVSCRNLLIYLKDSAQDRILPRLHFAIKNDGYLILGKAESVRKHALSFKTVSKPLRIFRRIPNNNARQFNFDYTLPYPQRISLYDKKPARRTTTDEYSDITKQMLSDHFTVGCILVDENMQILYQRGKLDLYLMQPEGTPSVSLFDVARTGLKSKIKEVIRECLKEERIVQSDCIFRTKSGDRNEVRITARKVPHNRMESNCLFLIFEKVQADCHVTESAAAEEKHVVDDKTLIQLEEELAQTREELNGMLEDLETSNEELVASNEEVMSMNEELQSSNEELETSKEEMQSLNEELSTLNSQLEEKLKELAQSNDYLSNLLKSTDIAVVFLDTDACVQRYTKAATELFNLIHSDLGRPISDLASKLLDTELVRDTHRVLDRLEPIEKEVHSQSGNWYLRKILPYRTADNRIDGVVITYSDVTEIKVTQERLKESETFWHRMFVDAPLFIAVMAGPDHRYIFENKMHRRMAGSRNVIGKPLLEAYPELEGTEAIRRFDQVYKSGQAICTNEFSARLKFGNSVDDGHYNQYLQPWFDDSGNVAGVLSIAIDVTETVEARKKLEMSEARFRAAGEAVPFGVWWCDKNGKTEYFSDSLLELTGKTLEEVRGDGWLEFIHEDEQAETIRLWRECTQNEEIWEKEHRIVAVDGSCYTVLTRGRPIYDEDNELTGWVGINLDISQRKRMENSIREQENLFRLAIKCAPIVVFKQDSNFRYTWMYNQAFTLKQNEIIGKSDEDLFPEISAELHKVKQQVIDSGTAGSFEFELNNGEDKEYWLIFIEPSYDSEGNKNGLVGAGLDITERKESERNLLDAKDAAEAANRAKSVFLSSMSHDIRTPLTAILGFAEILGDSLGNEQKEMAQNIQSASEHLMGTLESVLQLARLEGKQVHLNQKPVSLRDEVQKTLAIYRSLEKGKNFSFNCELPESEDLYAIVDLDCFNRVLNNLLGNAVKFTGDKAQISVRLLRNEEGKPEIVVEDSGAGVHPDFIDKLFEPFAQERRAESNNFKGSGLGLAICKQLVELMGGRIWAESVLGEWTKFHIELQAVDSRTYNLAKRKHTKITNSDSKKVDLVVCEDHKTTRDIVKLMLPDMEIRFIETPKNLLDGLKGTDVLLLDIEFDGEYLGGEIVKEIREDEDLRHIRVVAFTAHGLPGHREQLIAEGFDDYLAKPFTRDSLIKAIHGESVAQAEF